MSEKENGSTKGYLLTFPAECMILKEGEASSDMFKILKGNAELYTGYGTEKESLIGILGPGACFGEFGLLLQKPAIYTVIAFSEVYALRVTADRVEDFIRENHSSVLQIMKNMAQTMSIMQRQILDFSEEIYSLTRGESEKVEIKDIIKEYSLGSGVGLKGKMHFLGRQNR